MCSPKQSRRAIRLLAQVRGEKTGEAEQHGHLTQDRQVHLAGHAADAPVELRPELGALLRHLGAKRGAELCDSTVQVVLGGERVVGPSDLDLDRP